MNKTDVTDMKHLLEDHYRQSWERRAESLLESYYCRILTEKKRNEIIDSKNFIQTKQYKAN
jgi:hypothetical protein